MAIEQFLKEFPVEFQKTVRGNPPLVGNIWGIMKITQVADNQVHIEIVGGPSTISASGIYSPENHNSDEPEQVLALFIHNEEEVKTYISFGSNGQIEGFGQSLRGGTGPDQVIGIVIRSGGG